MGLVFHKHMKQGCDLGIWEINEDYHSLKKDCTLNDQDILILEGFRNPNRKLEWLSVRNLVTRMTGKENRIIYNKERKPFLENDSCNLSISHSNRFTSILMSKIRRVGIDLEYMSHRISKIEDKFIHPREKVADDPLLMSYHLYIHWCAKEALYKINDKKGLNFKKNLIIDPFMPEDSGILHGKAVLPERTETFNLNYFRMDNYIIVWCCK